MSRFSCELVNLPLGLGSARIVWLKVRDRCEEPCELGTVCEFVSRVRNWGLEQQELLLCFVLSSAQGAFMAGVHNEAFWRWGGEG